MATLVPSFLIESSSFLQLMRTCIHKWSNEIKFLPDPNIVYGVTCPRMSEKLTYNLVATLAPSFLIGSSSFL